MTTMQACAISTSWRHLRLLLPSFQKQQSLSPRKGLAGVEGGGLRQAEADTRQAQADRQTHRRLRQTGRHTAGSSGTQADTRQAAWAGGGSLRGHHVAEARANPPAAPATARLAFLRAPPVHHAAPPRRNGPDPLILPFRIPSTHPRIHASATLQLPPPPCCCCRRPQSRAALPSAPSLCPPCRTPSVHPIPTLRRTSPAAAVCTTTHLTRPACRSTPPLQHHRYRCRCTRHPRRPASPYRFRPVASPAHRALILRFRHPGYHAR